MTSGESFPKGPGCNATSPRSSQTSTSLEPQSVQLRVICWYFGALWESGQAEGSSQPTEIVKEELSEFGTGFIALFFSVDVDPSRDGLDLSRYMHVSGNSQIPSLTHC